MFVMVSYDVPAKRTGIYRKILKAFLVHEQESVFMGDLPESEVFRLTAKISERIGPEDRILKLVCRNRQNVQIRRLGKDPHGGPMREAEDEWHGKNWSVL